MRDIDAAITEWVDAKVLTANQAAKVRAFEAARPVADAEGTLAAKPGGSIGALGEALGYLGAAVVVAATLMLFGQSWSDLAVAQRAGIVVALAAVFGAGGVALARSAAPPTKRLADVLLACATGFATWAAGLFAFGPFDWDERAVFRAVTVVAVVCAGLVYGFRRSALPQLVALVAAIFIPIAVLPVDDYRVPTFGVAAVGAVWMLLGRVGVLKPGRVASLTGAIVLLIALQVTAAGELLWPLAVAIAGAGAVMALALTGRNDVALLTVGTVALFVFVPQVVARVFNNSAAVIATLLLVGLALVALAVWVARRSRVGRT